MQAHDIDRFVEQRQPFVYVTPTAISNWLQDAVAKLAIGNPPFARTGSSRRKQRGDAHKRHRNLLTKSRFYVIV